MLNFVKKTQGNLSLQLVPQLGGAIASLTYRGIDILRPLPLQDDVKVNQAGSFPLVPYSNRIANGEFEFDGGSYVLAKNFGDHPHSIHGNAWQQVWRVAEETSNRVVLKFLHYAENEEFAHWPWPYQATQVFELFDDELSITLTYFNLTEKTVPVGLGFHPYFANASDSLVRFNAERVLINNAAVLPQSVEAIPADWDYTSLRKPEAGTIDNCFVGWDGNAEIVWEKANVKAEITSPDAKNAVFFIPPSEKNFVAIEPVTNVNNAINDLQSGDNPEAMTLVPAGKSVSVTMKIKVSDYE